MARPTSYRPEFCQLAGEYAERGATDREVADCLGVAERTVHRWKIEHPEFGAALQLGKDVADRRVEQSLYRKAVGYTYDAEKLWHWEGKVVRAKCVEHVPPSDTAAIFWLKNRKAEQWREKSEMTIDAGTDLAAAIAAGRKRVAEDAERRRRELGAPTPEQPAQDK